MIHSETNKAQSLVPLSLFPLRCSQGFKPSVAQMLPEQSSISQTEQIQLLCWRTPCLTDSLCHLSHGPLQWLTINQDVNLLELFQCLIHCCHDGLRLPDIYRQRQALLPCGCNQLF